MAYRIAGIDVHKKKLAVVVADVEVDEEYQFERRWYGSNPEQLQRLAEWLIEQRVEEVVMESTAQYWKPVWGATGAVLEAGPSESGRCREDVGNTPSGASVVQSRTARAQERLWRCGTFGEAVGFPGADFKLRARWRTPSMADTHAHKVSTNA